MSVEYAYLVAPRNEPLRAGKVHRELKVITEKLDAVTIATHSHPWVIFIRCKEPLSDDELKRVEERIHQI